MKSLARTIINLAAFLELSSEDEIDPDSAVKALEQMMTDINSATDGEKEILKTLMRQDIIEYGESRTTEQSERVEFYLNFIEQISENDSM